MIIMGLRGPDTLLCCWHLCYHINMVRPSSTMPFPAHYLQDLVAGSRSLNYTITLTKSTMNWAWGTWPHWEHSFTHCHEQSEWQQMGLAHSSWCGCFEAACEPQLHKSQTLAQCFAAGQKQYTGCEQTSCATTARLSPPLVTMSSEHEELLLDTSEFTEAGRWLCQCKEIRPQC